MILGLGTDIVEVARVKTKITKEHGFREYVFSANEISYCEKKAHKYEHYAARFAAKEAFLKALGTGWANGTSFNEIEVINAENGKPGIILLGGTKDYVATLAIKTIWLTMAHVKEMATATVIVEG